MRYVCRRRAVGLEAHYLADQPYKQSAAVEKTGLSIGGQECRQHEDEDKAEVFDVEPKVAVAVVIPVEVPAEEAVVGGLLEREAEYLGHGKQHRYGSENDEEKEIASAFIIHKIPLYASIGRLVPAVMPENAVELILNKWNALGEKQNKYSGIIFFG